MTSRRQILSRQLRRVCRRLWLQTLLDQLVWFVSGAFVLAALWYVLQPLLFGDASPSVFWQVAGCLAGAAFIAAALVSVFRMPSALSAALALDARFGLKERVTSLLTLSPPDASSPAGLALLEDVEQRVSQLDVGSGFPLTWPRRGWLVAASAGLLAAVFVFYEPPKGQAGNQSPGDEEQTPANIAELEREMKKLSAKRPRPQTQRQTPTAKEIERIEAELEKIAQRPRENKSQLRERIKEMTDLESQLKKREQELAARQTAIKKQLERLQQKTGDQKGPADELRKALAENDLEKAKKEVERLHKKLKENELTEQQKEQLSRQLKEMQEELKRLSRREDEKEKLQQLAREGKLDPEQLQRELDRLEKEAKQLDQLKDLAQKLEECEQCLKKGDADELARKMNELAQQMQKMELSQQDLETLNDQLSRLQAAKKAACKGMGDGLKGNGLGKGEKPGGKRPVAEKGPTGAYDSKNRVEFDPKGQKIFDGYAPGQNFKKKTTAEIAGEIQNAQQQAPEVIDTERIPKAARDMAKGYFRNLGNQK
ncbi:MAG: hypothetical protein KatS3mg105_2330 [Gemmatales bacterium]|nr:MAG: hypothetical protein KatS3mg105_2330 [Gemmatales bacterium]